MKLLIAYGTTEGQTRKICHFLNEEAVKNGHSVSLIDTVNSQNQSPEDFDAAIVAASVHTGNYQTSIEHYVQKHREALSKIPAILLSVSLTAATDEPESWKELEHISDKFFEKTGWKPTHVEQVAGALKYSEYNFFKKFIMRMIAQKSGGDVDTSADYEYTDWKQVKNVLTQIEQNLTASGINNL